MPALPSIRPRNMASTVGDAATSLLYRRFDVWVYDYDDDDDDYRHHDHDDDWWDDRRHRRLSREMIIVIVASVLVLVGIMSLVVFCITRRKRCRYGYQQPVDAAPLMRPPPKTGQDYHNSNPQPPNNAHTGPFMDPNTAYAGAGPRYLPYGQDSRDGPSPPPYSNQK